MKSQVFDFKRIYIFVAKTTKSEIHEKSTSCEATPPVNAYEKTMDESHLIGLSGMAE